MKVKWEQFHFLWLFVVWADEPYFSPRGQPSTSYRWLLQLALTEVHGLLFVFSHLKCKKKKKKTHSYLWTESMLSVSLGSPWKTDGTLVFHNVSLWVSEKLSCHTGRQRWPEHPMAAQYDISQHISCPPRTSVEVLSFSQPRCPHCDISSPFSSKTGKVGISRLPQLMCLFSFKLVHKQILHP